MSGKSFVTFLRAAAADGALRARYRRRNLTQLLFHARNDGFDFAAAEVAGVIGRLESGVIQLKDGEAIDGHSQLWRRMWGRPYLDYVLDHLVARYTDEELDQIGEGG